MLFGICLAAAGCDRDKSAAAEPLAGADLVDIRARDTLVVLTSFNSTSYFIYRGEPMGFEYDLLRAFAHSEGLEMRVQVVGRDSLLDLLRDGAGDVAAGRLVQAGAQQEHVAFSSPLYTTDPVLVQRDSAPAALALPAPARAELPAGALATAAAPGTVRARLITQPWQLAGDSVFVPSRSPFVERLTELSDSLSGDITVVEVEGDISSETLIREVAAGQIDLTVSPENLAALRQSYYTNITVRPTLGPALPVAFALRDGSPVLRSALDRWLADSSTQRLRDDLYQRYFVDRRQYRERVASEYLTSETGRLSQYDSLFRAAAPQLGWDWRLLASQAFQESRFLPTARSWAGAVGLLQLMPSTARDLGVRNPRDPSQNVRGATAFLAELQQFWTPRIADSTERLKFVLAAYNVGSAHVLDAQRLAEKYGGDPLAWDDVAYWMLQLSKKSVYTDPVVKYGFARGIEPVTYVALVLERFEHYRQVLAAS